MQIINPQELLSLTKKLISYQSISPNDAGCMNFLENYLKNLGFSCTRLDRQHTSNLIAVIGNTAPVFAFAGHIDVVPAGNLPAWLHDPFELTEKDGLLYGRGIADMKGAVAGFIIAVKHYLKEYALVKGTVLLLVTSDEESLATDGTTVIVEYLKQQKINLDFCLIGEPSSTKSLGDILKIGRRGSLNGELEILGKQGHIAYPERCVNPIHLFAEALNELTKVEWDVGNEFFPPTSLQFANINSGLGVSNVIPGNLSASFNFRYNNLQTKDTLAKKVIGILDKYQLSYNIDWQSSAKPFLTKPGKLAKIVKTIIQEYQLINPQLKTDGGTSDGRFLVEITNELLEFGLINTSIHQINENIDKDDLSKLSDMYYLILYKIFND